MSRTSYRSIRFGYRGDRDALVSLFFKGLFFTLITFGIYGAWLSMNIRKYTHENMRYGEASFSNDANGLNWLLLNLKGYFLTIITLGIYFFWWQSDIYSYYFNNLKLTKDEEQIQFRSTTTGGGFFGLLLVNALIVSFTFGLGLPWAEMRLQKYICENVVMEGNLNLDSFTQTEENYKDATGEGAADFFDIELG